MSKSLVLSIEYQNPFILNQKFKTGLKFTKNFFKTGAFVETNEVVEAEICQFIPTKQQAVVVEFGMGHGNITQAILSKLHASSRLYAFEVNPEFCEHVKHTLQDDRLTIINDSAENLSKYVHDPLDGVISSIPFSFISKEVGAKILQNAHQQLHPDAYMSQVLLTKFNFKKFQQVFEACELLKLKSFPTYYIYHCQKLS